MNPEAAAGTRKGLSFPARFGFLQAASTCHDEAKRKRKDIVSNTKKLGFFFMTASYIEAYLIINHINLSLLEF